jgi:hypothetical protein
MTLTPKSGCHCGVRLRSILALSLLVAACDDERLPGFGARPDTGVIPSQTDAGGLDAALDAAAPEQDSGVFPDAAAPDAEPAPDAASEDAAAPDAMPAPDAAPADSGPADSGPADSGVPRRDAGSPTDDSDGDGLTDVQEGSGGTDTDGDGTVDSLDPDSDDDGLPDTFEAGDPNPSTPPIDTDGDGTPDYRDLDSDNNTVPDAQEGTGDFDGDALPDYRDLDDDDDFILDRDEGLQDSDGDLSPNQRDTDADGDGLLDSVEAGDVSTATPPLDSDFDGTPNFLDLDSDNDSILDAFEGLVDGDGDLIADSVDFDSDNDSVLDSVEAGDSNPATAPFDTDGDGIPDFRDVDSDADTISDLQEGAVNDTDGDGTPDRRDTDSDGDGATDAIEAGDANLVTPPVNGDLDPIPDFRDLDSDGDGLADVVELGCPGSTSRVSGDSDADGFVDLAEIAYGSNPCSAASVITDFYFVLPPGGPGANAPLTFTDTNIDRADVAINMDTTGSMQGEINNLRQRLLDTIIPGVDQVIPDAAFAVSYFEDYPIAPFGDQPSGDLPFRLLSRVTTNPVQAQTAVNQLVTRSGFDFPESGLESIYQITTGAGTSWAGGSVPAFNPNQNLIPGVADGTIGGVGFRSNALPIIVHITDAISHTRRDYQQVSASIAAASNAQVRTALSGVGARVVTVSSGLLPFNDILCSGQTSTFFGGITPQGDVDWFELQGAVAGDVITVEVSAAGYLSDLDAMVAVANANALIAMNDDLSAATPDSRLANVVLSGPGPYYIAVTASGDPDFNGSGGLSAGHYAVNATRNGTSVTFSPTQCRPDDPNSRVGASRLVSVGLAVAPADQALCQAECDALYGPLSPLFADFTFPVELSEETGAVIPTCAWSVFGASRPAGCPPNQCCTGQGGIGVNPNAQGLCPLAFQISGTGVGIDAAMVSAIEALVRFSPFTLSTVVREDPAELATSGIDTRCFIESVVPVSAVPPNACAPTPQIADLLPPAGRPDSFQNVVPGTVLNFQVNAINRGPTGQPCAPSGPSPRQFRAFIDVVADGITVVSTRQVIIIVPPTPVGGQN